MRTGGWRKEKIRMVRKTITYLVFAVLFISASAAAASFSLQFSATIDSESADVFPDSFIALGRTASEPNSLLMSALRQPPPPPARSYVQIKEVDGGQERIRSSRLYDPNRIEASYVMILTAYDANSIGLSGQSAITLENPEVLQQVPPDSLMYLRRFDAAGAFAESYDLSDPSNHTIRWAITGADGKYGEMELLVVDKCLAADLMVSDSIDLEDFAVLAADWDRSGTAADGDIFLDEQIDLKDLSILAEQWLCSCME
jgi:hypothetical protein